MVRPTIRQLFALALLGGGACGQKRENRPALVGDDTTTPASATIVQPMPTGGSFAGEQGSNQIAPTHADGAAEWGYELDSLDLRRKVTIRSRIRLHGVHGSAALVVAGTFVAPQSMSAGPNVIVSPEMQERVLRRALDGFM